MRSQRLGPRNNLLFFAFFLIGVIAASPGFGLCALQIHDRGRTGDQVITGRTYNLPAGESTTGDVIMIRGHARVDGIVDGDLVLIGSDSEVSGTVNGDIVAIASKIHFSPGAVVNGDFTSCISAVQDDANLHVSGSRTNLDLLPADTILGLGQWITGTILLLRPMSPDSFTSWLWALIILGLCLGIGWLFPKPLADTGVVLRERAPASFLCGLAIVPAAALLCFLLLITMVGILVIPLIFAAIFAFSLFGNAVVFQLIGQRLAPQMSTQKYPVLLWIALGAVVCWVLYCIPVIGFLAGSIVFLAGLGSFSLYLIERSKGRPVAAAQLTTGSSSGTEQTSETVQVETGKVKPVTLPRLPELHTAHSTFFWSRLGANLIDLVIIFALVHFLGLNRVLLPAWVLYRFAMYAWRSATIGEIVLNMRVQKLDGSLLIGDYGTALVRALSSLLSLLPLGLGFFWILFDSAGETWHDKIAGTKVVTTRLPAQRPPAPPPTTTESGSGEGPKL